MLAADPCFIPVYVGLVRSLTVSPDNNWIAIGFSSGLMSLLDQRTGYLMATWKGHEGEILQVCADLSLTGNYLWRKSYRYVWSSVL